jgi:hypothetical protein
MVWGFYNLWVNRLPIKRESFHKNLLSTQDKRQFIIYSNWADLGAAAREEELST